MGNLLYKIILMMRRWNRRQAAYEELERQQEKNVEALILGLGALVTGIIIVVICLKGADK